MKNLIIACLIGLLAGAVLTWVWVQRHESRPAASEPEKKAEEPKSAEAGLALSSEKQKAAGIKLLAAITTNTMPTVKVFGRVVDGSTLSVLLAETATARSTLAASSNEFNRLKFLYGQNQNTSARSFETAQATFHRDTALLESARIRLWSAWGRKIAERPDVQDLALALAGQEAALVRLDLTVGNEMEHWPEELNVSTLADDAEMLTASTLGIDPTVDPVTQGRGLLCLIKRAVAPVGTPMTGWIPQTTAPVKGILIPQAALLRNEGSTIVYVRVGEDIFKRVAVELLSRTSEGWLVEAGEEIKAGANLVVSGGAFLLSEELSKAGGGE